MITQQRRVARARPLSLLAVVAHGAMIALCAFIIILISLLVNAYLGSPSTPGTVPQLGYEAVFVALAHALIMYVAFNAAAADGLDVRVNPYVTLAEWLLERNLSWRVALTEVAAQALGATAAAAIAYGVLVQGPDPLLVQNVSSQVINTSAGWVLALEMVSGALLAWVYFHGTERAFPASMALVVGITSGLVYPVAGATTHNIFRWLAGCVVASTCGSAGAWVFPVGPLVGVLAGWAYAQLTRYAREEEVQYNVLTSKTTKLKRLNRHFI